MTRTVAEEGVLPLAEVSKAGEDEAIRVLVVDDHHIVREGLRRVLALDGGIRVVGEASDGEQAVRQTLALAPHVVVMDLKMPGMDGLTATREIKRMMPDVRVLMLTLYEDDFVRLAMDAGVSGYLLKDSDSDQIALAIHQVHEGLHPLAPSLSIRTTVEYADLFDRNWGYLTPEDQGKIRAATVLLAGCGLGSKVATLAARTGFTRFILADGDGVEVSNLNRQAFRLDQVGTNKAEATAHLIREVNPAADIEILPHFITETEAPELVSRADLVVNMVDAGPVLYALNRAAAREGKMAFFPLNVGYGGVALAFSPDSATLEDMIGDDASPDTAFFRLAGQMIPHLPYIVDYSEKLAPVLDDILSGERPGPQLGVAASVNAALLVTAMIRVTLGLPVRVTPLPLALDAWESSK